MAPDTPRPRRDPVQLSGVMVVCFCCALLIGASGMLWFAVAPVLTPPPEPVKLASPIVVQQAPFPAVLVKAAEAYVAKATETAPTPTWTPSPPTPSPTQDPTHFCGIDSVPGVVCRWPAAPAPTPTPPPPCSTPDPGSLCYWRES